MKKIVKLLVSTLIVNSLGLVVLILVLIIIIIFIILFMK